MRKNSNQTLLKCDPRQPRVVVSVVVMCLLIASLLRELCSVRGGGPSEKSC
jgi:hypothetical protein